MSVDEKATWQRYLTERREALISTVGRVAAYVARLTALAESFRGQPG